MGITKGDVRDWVEDKITQRRTAIWKVIRERQDAALDGIIEGMVSNPLFEKLTRHAQQFIDTMNEAKDEFEYTRNNVYYVGEAIRYAGMFSNLRKKEISSIKSSAVAYINKPAEESYTMEDAKRNEALYSVVMLLAAELKPEHVKLAELKKLEKELDHIIKNEHSGKRAYKAMLAAGVDMSGFEEEQKQKGNLPMVVKLSANVCVLNDNCG